MKKLIPKGQYGYKVPTQTWGDIGSVLNKGAEFFLKGLEPIGKVITSFAASPQHGATSYATTGQYRTQEKAKEQKLKEKAFEETVGPALSPSNHVVAWTQGSLNPKVGQQKIAEWGPLAQLGSLGVDAAAFKYVPKGIKTAAKSRKAYIISREIDKAAKTPIKQKELSNQFIEQYVTNPKGSGKIVHYDNGDGRSVFRNSGAKVENGYLVPGQTTRNQSNFTWWNKDNPYLNVHKSTGQFSPSRYIIVDQSQQFVHPLKAGKSVGQSDGAGRGFILPTEIVSETPVDLSNAIIIQKSPFGWWERVKIKASRSRYEAPSNILQEFIENPNLGEEITSGGEATIFKHPNNNKQVIKLKEGLQPIQDLETLSQSIGEDLQMNTLPGMEPLTYKGFTEAHNSYRTKNSNGNIITKHNRWFVPIYEQTKITPLSKIADPWNTLLDNKRNPNIGMQRQMQKLGYKLVNKDGLYSYSIYPEIGDINEHNVGFNNYEFRLIDPMIHFDKIKKKKGGKLCLIPRN